MRSGIDRITIHNLSGVKKSWCACASFKSFDFCSFSPSCQTASIHTFLSTKETPFWFAPRYAFSIENSWWDVLMRPKQSRKLYLFLVFSQPFVSSFVSFIFRYYTKCNQKFGWWNMIASLKNPNEKKNLKSIR